MTNNAVMAFSAGKECACRENHNLAVTPCLILRVNCCVCGDGVGDAALTQSPHWPIFTDMTHSHAMRAMSSLRTRLKEHWPRIKDASIVLTAFNLFCYGVRTHLLTPLPGSSPGRMGIVEILYLSDFGGVMLALCDAAKCYLFEGPTMRLCSKPD